MSQLKRTLWHVLMGSTVGLLAISSLAAADRRAQQANWDNLKELTPGQDIKIVLNDAKAYQGRLETVSDEAIRVFLPTGRVDFARQDILRVSTRTGSHRLRNAGIGAGIGAGAGAGIAAHSGDIGSCTFDGGCPVAGVIALGAIGAVVAALLPSEAWHDVYRAR